MGNRLRSRGKQQDAKGKIQMIRCNRTQKQAKESWKGNIGNRQDAKDKRQRVRDKR